MYVCVCNAVTDREIQQCVELGATSLAEVRDALGVATCCGKCACHAAQLIQERAGQSSISALQPA